MLLETCSNFLRGYFGASFRLEDSNLIYPTNTQLKIRSHTLIRKNN